MKVILAVVVALALAHPAIAVPRPPASLQKALANTRAALDDELVDYQATRFRRVSASTLASGAVLLCGQTNARNRMGGLAGWQDFFSLVGPSGAVQLVFDPAIYPLRCGAARGGALVPGDFSSELTFR